MKNKIFAIALLALSMTSFGQKSIKEDLIVGHTRLPLTVLTGVKTFDCNWEKDQIPEFNDKSGYDQQTIKGFLSPQGFTYTTDNPDVIITLKSNAAIIPIPEYVNMSNSEVNYRAKYSFTPNWTITISGKINKSIDLSEKIGKIEIMFPTYKDGSLDKKITSKEALENDVNAKQEQIIPYIKDLFAKEMLSQTKNIIASELGYTRTTTEIRIESFKSNKKNDMTAWQAPFERGIELLKKLDQGENPNELYTQYKDIFDFWDGEFAKLKDNYKGNKKVIRAAIYNLVNILTLTNPNAIKDEYITLLKEVDADSYTQRMKAKEYQERQTANIGNTPDFKTLAKLPVLKNYRYEVVYKDNKGNEKQGVILFYSPFNLDPYQFQSEFKLYDLDTYNSVHGEVSNKMKLDVKNVDSYHLYGKNYIKLKYTDPTVASIGGNEGFLEEIITGKMSLYKFYPLETEGIDMVKESDLEKSRTTPSFVVNYGKKTTVAFNYKRLAKMLSDCKEVADKINNGEYGNKEIKEKTSKFGKFMQEGSHSEIPENTIITITNDFNKLL